MILWIPAASCTAVALVGWLLVLRRRFVVVRVRGCSMLPGLRPGERVLVRRGHDGLLCVGTVAVLRSPRLGDGRWAIKRVAALPGDPVPEVVRTATAGVLFVPDGMLVVLADNPSGTDSRCWGFVAARDMLGPVIGKVSR